MAPTKRKRRGGGMSPPHQNDRHVSPTPSIAMPSSSSRHQPSAIYPGLLQASIEDIFNSSTHITALAQLHEAVRALRSAAVSVADSSIVLRRQRVQWTRTRGDDRDSEASAQWEVTVPASGLDAQQLQVLARRARSTCLSPGLDRVHFKQIQTSSAALADAVLQFWRRTGASVADDVYFICAQVTDAPAHASRGRHVDPAPIAAALATFSLEGSAIITVEAGPHSVHSHLQCSCSSVYMLTGAALVDPVHHAVEVLSSRRLSITLRFAVP